MPLTYQNVWALKKSNEHHEGRFVIGKSVFLPLLSSYSDSPEAESQAARPIFQLNYLN